MRCLKNLGNFSSYQSLALFTEELMILKTFIILTAISGKGVCCLHFKGKTWLHIHKTA